MWKERSMNKPLFQIGQWVTGDIDNGHMFPINAQQIVAIEGNFIWWHEPGAYYQPNEYLATRRTDGANNGCDASRLRLATSDEINKVPNH